MTKKVLQYGKNDHLTRVTGVMGDDTSTITYIAWHDAHAKVLELLTVGENCVLENVKVNVCAKQWALTPTPLQLIITGQSRIVQLKGDKPLKCPLGLTPICQLREASEQNVNVAGVIIKKHSETRTGTERLLVTIRDQDAEVHVSFQNAAVKEFKGDIGQVMMVRNALCKVYSNYVVVRGNGYNYTLDEKSIELDKLKENTFSGPPTTCMSPPKEKPKQVTSVQDLQHGQGKQEFKAKPYKAQIKLYNMCPIVGCRRRVHQNEQSKIYNCDNCNKQFISAADGLTIDLQVVSETKTVDVVLFNDTALHFIQEPLCIVKDKKDDPDALLEPLKDNTYKIQVIDGKTKGEYICQEIEIHEKSNGFSQSSNTEIRVQIDTPNHDDDDKLPTINKPQKRPRHDYTAVPNCTSSSIQHGEKYHSYDVHTDSVPLQHGGSYTCTPSTSDVNNNPHVAYGHPNFNFEPPRQMLGQQTYRYSSYMLNPNYHLPVYSARMSSQEAKTSPCDSSPKNPNYYLPVYSAPMSTQEAKTSPCDSSPRNLNYHLPVYSAPMSTQEAKNSPCDSSPMNPNYHLPVYSAPMSGQEARTSPCDSSPTHLNYYLPVYSAPMSSQEAMTSPCDSSPPNPNYHLPVYSSPMTSQEARTSQCNSSSSKNKRLFSMSDILDM